MSHKRNPKFDGVVVSREVHADGTICTSDQNGRLCWDSIRKERVVLSNDLRKYGQGLHIGQLGRTIPGTTDGYKWIDVAERDSTKPVKGASETIEEGFSEILARGDKVFFQVDKHSAAVRIGIESPEEPPQS